MKPDRKSPLWAIVYTTLLIAFTGYVLLDTFVIERAYAAVPDGSPAQSTWSAVTQAVSDSFSASKNSGAAISVPSSADSAAASEPIVTDTSYRDDSVAVTLSTYRQSNTTVYVADIVLTDPARLCSAFARDIYGRNVTQTASVIAQEHSAILAINGDFYGARSSGYVIRNGVLYRDSAASASQQDLVIYADGSFRIITEGQISAQQLLDDGAQQVLSFGPALIESGEIAVTAADEVDKAMTSNPRTAIGRIGENHYVMVVSDGRTSASEGLSVYELAAFLQGLGAETAYNLDGGGSSTMVFNGTVVNQPTTSGKRISERSVSDIVCICK